MNILITGGGCEERIDGVRNISNYSSGKTSCEIAEFLFSKGMAVTLLSGLKALKPSGPLVHSFKSFEDLKNLLIYELQNNEYDAVIHLAAVSDYSVDKVIIDDAEYSPMELDKLPSGNDISIKLKRNPKLIESIKKMSKKPCILIGFKLTNNATINERIDAVKKVFRSPSSIEEAPDYIVSNDLSEFTENLHPCTIYDRELNAVDKVQNISELCERIYSIIMK